MVNRSPLEVQTMPVTRYPEAVVFPDTFEHDCHFTGDDPSMERNRAYVLALVAGAVVIIIAAALMVPLVTGSDTGSEESTSAGNTITLGVPPSGDGRMPQGDGNNTPGEMPGGMDGNFTPPDGGGGMMPGDLP